MVAKFKPGKIVSTKGIADEIANDDNKFLAFVSDCLIRRYLSGDWGEMEEVDIQSNDEALKVGNRLLASYEIPDSLKSNMLNKFDEKIWIITEWDRSVTTILFPSEY